MQTILNTLVLPYITIHLIETPKPETIQSIAELPDHTVDYYNKKTGEDVRFYLTFENKRPIESNPNNIREAFGEAVHAMISEYAASKLGLDIERMVETTRGTKRVNFDGGKTNEEIERETNEAISHWNANLFNSIYVHGPSRRDPECNNKFSLCKIDGKLRFALSLGKGIVLQTLNERCDPNSDFNYRNSYAWGLTGQLNLYSQRTLFVVAKTGDPFYMGYRKPIDLAEWLSPEVAKEEIMAVMRQHLDFMGVSMWDVLSDITFDEKFERPADPFQCV